MDITNFLSQIVNFNSHNIKFNLEEFKKLYNINLNFQTYITLNNDLMWYNLLIYLDIHPELIPKVIEYGYFSSSKLLTEDFIEKYDHLNWGWDNLLNHHNFSHDFIQKYKNKVPPKNTKTMIFSPSVYGDYIPPKLTESEYYQSGRWLYEYPVSPRTREEYIKTIENLIEHKPTKITWNDLSKSSIPLDLVEKYIDQPWNFGFYTGSYSSVPGLSDHGNLTIEFVEKYINKGWLWDEIFNKNLITLAWVERNADKLGDNFWNHRRGISGSEITTMDFVRRYSNKPWHFGEDGLSSNPNLTLDFMREYVDTIDGEEWDFTALSENPAVTIDFIYEFDGDWNYWDIVKHNPDITLQFLYDFHDEIFHFEDDGSENYSNSE